MLRAAIEQAGGIASAADLARRWGITRGAVSELARREDFPVPLPHTGAHRMWAVSEADAWWSRHRAQASVPDVPADQLTIL
jgi:predicted DNA-binding transcriptional regulator AlpA